MLMGLLVVACGPAASRPTPASSASPQGVAAAPAGATTYVALGASDAFGVGTSDPDRQNWPRVLAGELGAHVHLVNLGLPGATVADAQRMELPVALASHPTIVTVWLVVNDFADGVDLTTYTQQLGALLGALRSSTPARVYVGNLPDLTLVAAWNAAIADVCAANGARLVDLWSDWSDLASHPGYISSDGLHPSTLGAAKLADVFAAAIRTRGAP
jgi:acyl-CoA thioesterase-1